MRVPFVDLAAQSAEIADQVAKGFEEVIAASAFINGRPVADFEQAYAAFVEVRNCIGVANGTDALELALRGAGVTAGDEVIVQANTFIATAAAVVRLGARPVFVDMEPEHSLIDVGQVADAIGPRTRAIVPVHLYGQMAPMAELEALVRDRDDIVLVEDAAQAQGARQFDRAAGSIGVAAATSFYPGKNLGAYGDAGAVLTNDDAIAETVRKLHDHGSRVKYEHEIVGWNSRLDTLQAVVLAAKLERLPDWNAARARRRGSLPRVARAVRRDRRADHGARQRARLAPLRGAGPRTRRSHVRAAGRRPRGRHPLPDTDSPPAGVRRVRRRSRHLPGRRGRGRFDPVAADAPAPPTRAAGARRDVAR